MPHPHTSPGDKIIAFAPLHARAAKRPPVHTDGERGRILLFTGVRYERMKDPIETTRDEPLRLDLRDDIWA